MSMDELRKHGEWYRGPVKDWQTRLYGHKRKSGVGDLIYNTLRKIIETDDKSEWAYQAFDLATVLLIQGKRWPDEMNIDNQCKTRICSLWNKEKFRWLKKRNKLDGVTIKYRSQNDMTRDPWVMYYAAAIHLGEREFIFLKPQTRVYRPTLWALRKALLGKKNSYKFWRTVDKHIDSIFGTKDFVTTLQYYMDWCYDRR